MISRQKTYYKLLNDSTPLTIRFQDRDLTDYVTVTASILYPDHSRRQITMEVDELDDEVGYLEIDDLQVGTHKVRFNLIDSDSDRLVLPKQFCILLVGLKLFE